MKIAIRQSGAAIFGIAAFLGVCELLFRLLPVSTATETGYYIDPMILSYPAHHHWRMATGWDLRNAQTLTSNNLGFVSEHDFFSEQNAIALVGDSYVEASMLAVADRPAAQLERALNGRSKVYAFGAPGTALLDYAERIRFAHDRLGLREFVVLLEAGDLRQSLCGSGNIHSQCMNRETLAIETHRVPDASSLKVIVRRSALAQYVFSQLKPDARLLLSQLLNGSTPSHPREIAQVESKPAAAELPDGVAARTKMVSAVANAFFARVGPAIASRLVMVVDGERQGSVNAPGSVNTELSAERLQFMKIAQAAGATVVDAEKLYAAHAKGSPLSLNVGPYDGHLNRIGVSLVMRAAAAAML